VLSVLKVVEFFLEGGDECVFVDGFCSQFSSRGGSIHRDVIIVEYNMNKEMSLYIDYYCMGNSL